MGTDLKKRTVPFLNEAKLYLTVDESESDLEITPFTYIVRNENGDELCRHTGEEYRYVYAQEELKLENFKEDTKKIELEILNKDATTVVTIKIDLENREIEVVGNEKELEKISEQELKQYLSIFSLLNYNDENLDVIPSREALYNERNLMIAKELDQLDDKTTIYSGLTENSEHNMLNTEVVHDIVESFTNLKVEEDGLMKLGNVYAKKEVQNGELRYIDMPTYGRQTGVCLDISDIMYSQGVYTVTFTYCYPKYTESHKTYEEGVEDLPIYEMTIGLTINEDQTYSKYHVSTWMEPQSVQGGENEDADITEISAKCKETLEKYLYILGKAEGAPESLLNEFDLLKYEDYYKLQQDTTNIQGNYVKTSVRYTRFKYEMLNYMTEELYENIYGRTLYKNLDGYLGVLNVGATGITFEIVTMDLTSNANNVYTYEVVYKEDLSDGLNKTMIVTMQFVGGKYVVSNIEYQQINEVAQPTEEEIIKKFIGEWHLDYAIGNTRYEQKISDLYGEGGAVTLTINEDGTFTEFIKYPEYTSLDKGKYSIIDENTMKLIYRTTRGNVFVTYSTNALGETVISLPKSVDESITEYYSQKDVSLYETKDYFIGDWWRTTYSGIQEELQYMISIRSDGEILVVRDNQIVEIGTYRVNEDNGEGVPQIVLQLSDGNKELNLMQGSESYLMTQDLKEQYQYYSSVG